MGLYPVLIMDGESKVFLESIVLPENPNYYEDLVALEIALYLRKITGNEIKIRSLSKTAKTKGAIFLGNAAIQLNTIQTKDLEKVSPDGYVISSESGSVSIAGARGVGILYGAYGFLEKLGVKFYAIDCEIIPKKESLKIPSFYISKKPFFEQRINAIGGSNLKLGYTPRRDYGDARRVDSQSTGGFVHSSDYLVPAYKYLADHPEYFARDETGKNFDYKGGVHLCLSNPDVLKIAKKRVLDWIENQKDAKFFSATQGDGFNWCQCENCRDLDTIPGTVMSDRLLYFVNEIAQEVAKKYPDKIICTLAYTPATQPPPKKIKLLPNVRIWFCPYPTEDGAYCQSHDLFCERNKGALKDLKGWLAWAPEKMYIFDYPGGYQNLYEPFGSFYAMSDKLKFYAKNNIKGIYYCGAPMLFRSLFLYVQDKLLWNPELDVEKLIDEFMSAYYGETAPEMREFFNFFYTIIKEKLVHQMCEGTNPGLVTPDFAMKAYAIFRRAEEKVKDEPQFLKRVLWEKLCGVLWADLNENTKEKLFEKSRVNKEMLWKFKELVEICRTFNIAQFSRGQEAIDWVSKIFGVKLKTYPWYNDPLVEKIVSSKEF